jgi:predicted Zn-dependent protease
MFYSLARWPRWILAAVVLVCMTYTAIFAVQLRLNMIPTGRLTFAELITDKLRLDRALRRRALFVRAAELNRGGDAAGAAAVLTEAIGNYGEDRNLLSLLAATSRESGHDGQAQYAEARLSALRSREIW